MNDANAFRNSSFPRGPTTGATNLKSLANSAGSSAPLFLARMRLVLAMRVSGETGNVEDASMAASSTICVARNSAMSSFLSATAVDASPAEPSTAAMADERRFEARAICAARGETRREEARRAEGAAEPAVATEDAMANMAATACVERRAMKW